MNRPNRSFGFANGSKWLRGAAIAVAFAPIAGHAEDIPPPGGSGLQRFAIDSTFDVNTFRSRSVDVNGLFALAGNLNESGFRIRLTGSASWYRFLTGDTPQALASGRGVEGQVLGGYGFVAQRVSILGVVGLAVANSEDDPGINRTQVGAKAVLSAYATPTDQTMVFGRASYSTINNAHELQLKTGLKILQVGYLGPETKFSGRNNNNEWRFGPHLSGIAIGPAAVSISGGWLTDRQLGSGFFFSTSLYAAF